MGRNKRKNKKAKQQPARLSPPKYIKTKGRGLPVYDCRVSEEWQAMGLATVVIARQQPSGNLIMGVYLVDTMCLGVKDTFYEFNITSYEYKDLLSGMEIGQILSEVDYTLAHNIIYGAIDFAEEYGFTPHKDFAITQYLLEEDHEAKVPFIELDFGNEGVPVLFVKAGMNPNKYIAQLNQSAGEGNYEVVYQEGGHKWDDEDDDDEFLPLDPERPFRNYLENYWQNRRALPTKEDSPLQVISYDVSFEPMESAYSQAYAEQIDTLVADMEEAYHLTFDDPASAVERNREFIEKYPKHPVFYNYLINSLGMSDQADEANNVSLTLYEKFPEYLFAKLGYANWLLSHDRIDEAFQAVGENYSLDGLYPDQQVFHYTEVLAFNAFLCRYLVADERAETALGYYQLMYQLDAEHPMTTGTEAMLGMALVQGDLGDLISRMKDEHPELIKKEE